MSLGLAGDGPRGASAPAGTTRGPVQVVLGMFEESWSDSASCSGYFRLRWTRRSKSTWWASNSGPSTQANWRPRVVRTRQPPHMPVPSTISEFRLTTVLMPCGRVDFGDRLHHPRRPDRQHEVDLPARRDQLLELVGHEPLLP